jgi:DNA-directed RNA polymerase alpha subunit
MAVIYDFSAYREKYRETPAYSPRKDFSDGSLEKLGLRARSMNAVMGALDKYGVYTVDRLCALTERDIEYVRYAGPKTIEDIKSCLARIGRRLAENPGKATGLIDVSAGL